MTNTLARSLNKRKRHNEFESIGDILRRMRLGAEAQMTEIFSRPLSLKLDHLLAFEQRVTEEWGE